MTTPFIKSPLNYTGGKFKILEHILPGFPAPVNRFVDLFAGGLNVGINAEANVIYANDQITYLIDLYEFFRSTPVDVLLEKSLNMLHYEVAAALNEIPNLHYKGMKIWADESTKPYPYGYPFSFVANQIHQYILVFRKEK